MKSSPPCGTHRAERKRLGAFYTPESLSRVLTDWAVRSASDRVLEPSFGCCGFLAAAQRRLRVLGCKKPNTRIFGCDIDDKAFVFLDKVLGSQQGCNNFMKKDFLDLQPKHTWPMQFDAVIGNPPYIPYQSILESRRNNFTHHWTNIGIALGKRASLWAYFVLHATSFMTRGGRMAWVLPGSFLQADYAIAVRDYIENIFERILCVRMKQRFFKHEGTEEETVIVFADNYTDASQSRKMYFSEAETIDALEKILSDWEKGPTTQTSSQCASIIS